MKSDTENAQMNMLTKHDINQCFKGMSQCLSKCKSLSLGGGEMKLGTFSRSTITVLMCYTRERYTHFMAFNQETF